MRSVGKKIQTSEKLVHELRYFLSRKKSRDHKNLFRNENVALVMYETILCPRPSPARALTAQLIQAKLLHSFVAKEVILIHRFVFNQLFL